MGDILQQGTYPEFSIKTPYITARNTSLGYDKSCSNSVTDASYYDEQLFKDQPVLKKESWLKPLSDSPEDNDIVAWFGYNPDRDDELLPYAYTRRVLSRDLSAREHAQILFAHRFWRSAAGAAGGNRTSIWRLPAVSPLLHDYWF